ncbi:MAG TPA: thioredoxin-disulfide reductase [Candidatus Magasanikbacteria bacterium]|nr:thioredoxin-disulfide reductase [Candidatus Magasanikbacteria bacterium]
MHDLIILGGSAAGVTAAIYAARRQLDIKLIAGDIGGEIATTDIIENYPGYVKVGGLELAEKFKEQLKYNNVSVDEGWLAKKIEKKDNYFVVTAKNFSDKEKTYETKTVIVATGVHPRHLGVPGEKELFHRGVTYCAVCDAPLFKNKIVAVVGGGNSALESALMLGEIAAQVFFLNRNPQFKGEAVLIEKVKKHSKITVLTRATTQKILGEKSVTGVEYEDAAGQTQQITVNGIFVHVGWEPNADFIDLVKKNTKGEIMVDQNSATDVPGIFAAGDVTDTAYKQIIVAAGMGATAALSAVNFLNKK